MTSEQNQNIKITVKTIGEIKGNDRRPNPYLLPGLLRRGQKLAITAPRKSLKTSLAIQLALSLAKGTRWLEWRTPRALEVLYINLNHNENDFISKFFHSCYSMGVTDDELNRIDLVTFQKGEKLANVIDLLTEGISKKYQAIIIDSLDNLQLPTEWGDNIDTLLTKLVRHFEGALIFTQSHRHRPKGNRESRDLAEWSDCLSYSDSLLEFVKMQLDPELLRRERLEAVWELSKKVMKTHNKTYFLMNVTDKYLKNENATSEELRKHVALALDNLPIETREGILTDFDKIDIPLKYRTYWRLETVTTETAEVPPIDFLFHYPEVINDRDKILAFHEPGLTLPKKYLEQPSQIKETNKEKRTKKLINAIEEFNDKFGHSPSQKELSEYMEVDRTSIYNWVKETNGEVFLGPEGYDFL